ncbi:plastocyanin/azurin family copper-binding protein [Halostella sp. PRR32]|uniref:cupredoxin domain-containing protein n=1 Tax=Halostella sp. PRR32 TaxID=3098147 RepID=UPI002B1E1324|nr:plastocyanin/azurin family copper-binding protein [Halostella sp. PRR32]
MNRRRFLSATAALSTPLVAGCGDGNSDGSDGEEDVADETVTITDESFDPVRLSAAEGATVEWVNETDEEHTVTSAEFHDDAESWDATLQLAPDGNAAHSFDFEGIYEYYCSNHGRGTMCGLVLVGDVSEDEDMPCE